jgi:prefoldin subunit 5
VDPVSQLATQNRVLQTEVDRLRQRIKELEATA